MLMNCHEKLLTYAFCQLHPGYVDVIRTQEIPGRTYCPVISVTLDSSCFLFNWHHNDLSKDKHLKHYQMEQGDIVPFVKTFKYIFKSISSPLFPPVICDTKQNTGHHLHQIIVKKLLHSMLFQWSMISSVHAEGFVITKAKHIVKSAEGMTTAICQGVKIYISVLSVCDGLYDCPSGTSDEDHCLCNSTSTKMCKEVSFGKRKQCSDIYYLSIERHCMKYNFGEKNTELQILKPTIQSINGRIQPHFLNDLIPDCDPSTDEPVLEAFLKHSTHVTCENPEEVPCMFGHSKCFSIADVCRYSHDAYGNLSPCRNGGHLENCKEVHCGVKFKCSYSYCIPWVFVCDGKWDCPSGDDEVYFIRCYSKTRCEGMYKCQASILCATLGSLCDSILDCPLQDDEQLCDLNKLQCSFQCECLAYATKCVGHFPFPLPILYPYHFVSLLGVNLTGVQEVSDKLPNLLVLQLFTKCITDVCGTVYPSKIHTLDVRVGGFSKIRQNCFSHIFSLRILKLDLKDMRTIEEGSFVNLYSLQILILRGNPIAKCSANFIINCSVSVLVILNIQVMDTLEDIISLNSSVGYIISDDYHTCCIQLLTSFCLTKMHWFTTCSNLLPVSSMMIVYVLVSCLTVFVNIH